MVVTTGLIEQGSSGSAMRATDDARKVNKQWKTMELMLVHKVAEGLLAVDESMHDSNRGRVLVRRREVRYTERCSRLARRRGKTAA